METYGFLNRPYFTALPGFGAVDMTLSLKNIQVQIVHLPSWTLNNNNQINVKKCFFKKIFIRKRGLSVGTQEHAEELFIQFLYINQLVLPVDEHGCWKSG